MCSYEIGDNDEGLTQDTVTVRVYEENGEIKSTSPETSPDSISKSFYALNQAMGKSAEDRWGSAEIQIEEDGNYKLTYSYEPPPRINGIYNDETYRKYGRYAEIYKAERRT